MAQRGPQLFRVARRRGDALAAAHDARPERELHLVRQEDVEPLERGPARVAAALQRSERRLDGLAGIRRGEQGEDLVELGAAVTATAAPPRRASRLRGAARAGVAARDADRASAGARPGRTPVGTFGSAARSASAARGSSIFPSRRAMRRRACSDSRSPRSASARSPIGERVLRGQPVGRVARHAIVRRAARGPAARAAAPSCACAARAARAPPRRSGARRAMRARRPPASPRPRRRVGQTELEGGDREPRESPPAAASVPARPEASRSPRAAQGGSARPRPARASHRATVQHAACDSASCPAQVVRERAAGIRPGAGRERSTRTSASAATSGEQHRSAPRRARGDDGRDQPAAEQHPDAIEADVEERLRRASAVRLHRREEHLVRRAVERGSQRRRRCRAGAPPRRAAARTARRARPAEQQRRRDARGRDPRRSARARSGSRRPAGETTGRPRPSGRARRTRAAAGRVPSDETAVADRR